MKTLCPIFFIESTGLALLFIQNGENLSLTCTTQTSRPPQLMMMKFVSCLFLTFCVTSLSHAQLMKTLHQTFEVQDFNEITLELLSDSTAIEPWAGNTIMTETKVELYDASPSLLRHFIEKQNRYGIQADTLPGVLRIHSTVDERKPIVTKHGNATEIVYIRVFVPQDFKREEGFKLVRSNP